MQKMLKNFDLEELFEYNIYQTFGRKQSLVLKRQEMALYILGSFASDIVSV
jgi:hypothetical protein